MKLSYVIGQRAFDMTPKRWLAFWITSISAVVATVSNYDAFSSQFEWRKIPDLLKTVKIAIPSWLWVAIAQSILIGWLIWDRRRQHPIAEPAISQKTAADASSDRKLDHLSGRVTLTQNHVSKLLDQADQFHHGLTRLTEAESTIAKLNKLTLTHSDLLTEIEADLKNKEDRLDKMSMTVANVVALIANTDPVKFLHIILRKMDALADSTYGGSISPLSNPAFTPHPINIKKFESLASLAADIAIARQLPINIPCDAGVYWFLPSNPGIPEFSHNRHHDLDLQRIMRLRCDHHLIGQYLQKIGSNYVETENQPHDC